MQQLLTAVDTLFFGDQPLRNIKISRVIRLSFHDCMQGCDGSININNIANRGLNDTITRIHNAYNWKNYQHHKLINDHLSFADFLALV